MSDKSLLQKVLHGKTQNVNESVNSVIWSHCPKEVFVGALRVKSAAAFGIAKFNRGSHQLSHVMEKLNLDIGRFTESILDAKDRRRISQSDKAAALTEARRLRRANRMRDVQQHEEAEGDTYGQGLLADE